jgi:hypothetical protein
MKKYFPLSKHLTINQINNNNTNFKTNFMKQILLFIFLSVGLGLSTKSLAQTTTATVTSIADDGSSGTLRWAIGQANANGSINQIIFNPGLTGTIVLTSNLPAITKTLTITGPGTSVITVSGNRLYNMFRLVTLNTTLTVSALTFIKSAGGDGSIFYLNKSNVQANNIVVTDNANGTPFFVAEGFLLSITNSTFSNNTTTLFRSDYGNTPSTTAPDADYENKIIVTGSTFSNNTQIIFATQRFVKIDNCTFTSNTNGVGSFAGLNRYQVINSTFNNNLGGLFSFSSSLSSGTFVSTLGANHHLFDNNIFSGNTGTVINTGSLNEQSKTTITNNRFTNNGTPWTGTPAVYTPNSFTLAADLSAMALSVGTLSPAFFPNTTTYTASVSGSTTSIIVTPTRADANATIQVRVNAGTYATVTSGSPSSALSLNVGANPIDVRVTAQDLTTKTYTLTVTRAKANQTITFPALANKTTSDVDYEPGATVNSGLALRYTSSNTAVATVYQDATDGNKWKISIQGSGTTDITAIQDGNSDYNSTSFLRALTVGISLPVTLVNYDAKLNTNGTVQLTWLTASETNNSYFELQRSTDGISFTTIAQVAGAGNVSQEKRYNFTDLSPLAGTNYYQLVQYDKDGKKTDLGVRSVKVLLKENELTVYPNPSNGIVNVSFDINSYQKVELVDLTGKILLTKTIGKQANTINFDISDLSAGVYNIRLTGEGKLAIKQIVKH